MTLGRQLFMAFIALISLVIVGAFVISINNTRSYLSAQLESNANDAAVSLGMALSSIVDEEDEVLVARTVDSLFDGGYYQQILVQSHNGKISIKREAPAFTEVTPAWFQNAMSLEPPLMQALVMGGWSEWGSVKIRSNPGYAYEQLWRSFVDSLILAMVSIVGAIGLVAFLLKIMLTPLKIIEAQANAVSKRDFRILDLVPKTREFRQVVLAMNKMSQKLMQMFNEQNLLAENLRKKAYIDSLSGLGNRRSLIMQLDQMTRESNDTRHAALAILKVENMDGINRDYGFAVGNDIIVNIAQVLVETLDSSARVFSMGPTFGLLLFNTSSKKIVSMADELILQISTLRFSEVDQVNLHMGIAEYMGSENTRDLLSAADMALRKAEQRGQNSYHLVTEKNEAQIRSGEEWRDIINSLFEDKYVKLVYQPVQLFDQGSITQYEALARFVDDKGQPVPAGTVFPMAERYHLSHKLDKVIVDRVFSDFDRDWSQGCFLSINLSIQSVDDKDFQLWLETKVKRNVEAARRLIVEISEQQFHSRHDEFVRFMQRFRQYGILFSIDQFGINAASFGFLKSLNLDQLKVDGSFIHGLQENTDNQFYLRSLTDIAHQLDIRILANFVEQESELKTVQSLGMDGAQGYHVGKPKAAES